MPQQSTKSPIAPTPARRQPAGGDSRPSSAAWQDDQAALPDLEDPGLEEDASSPQEQARARVESQIADLIAKGDVGERLEALLTLWRAAADAGVPEEAMQEFRIASFDPDPEIAALASRALEDLERLRESQSGVETDALDDEFSDTFDGDPTGRAASTAAVENVEDLVAAGLEQHVARFEEATPEERLEALLELWRYAADSGVPERALEVMELISNLYPDLRVAEKAETSRSLRRRSRSGHYRRTIPI